MSPLAARLDAALHQNAARPALRIGGMELTYAELGGRARGLAAVLATAAPADGRIGLLANRSVEAYVAVLAAVLAGRAYVPISPAAPLDRQRTIAAAARCAGYLVDSGNHERGSQLAAEFGGFCLTATERAATPRGEPHSPAGRHAYVMFTSGTTGVPKGVAVRTDNVAAYLDGFREIASLGPDDRCTQFFDLSFDLSVHDMFVTWANGALLCVPTDGELIDPVGFAVREKCTCWFSVPSAAAMAKRMRRLHADALPDLRLALFCGEPLPVSLAADFAAAAPSAAIYNLYGPTEATIAITAHRFCGDSSENGPPTVPLGNPYPGCATMIVDSEGRRTPPDGTGELWLAGAQLTDGYINNPDEQAAKFVEARFAGCEFDRWYRSGDIVRHDVDHGLIYQGRVDDQIKISGYRVEILEVEAALRIAADTAEAAAVPFPLNAGGSAEGLVGILAHPGGEDRAILQRCRSALPSYMVPKRIVRVDALPRNANGKLDRKALKALVSG